MSKLNPATCPAAQFATPDFLDRIELVETEVQRRKEVANPKKARDFVMEQWLKWVRKDVWNESARSTAA